MDKLVIVIGKGVVLEAIATRDMDMHMLKVSDKAPFWSELKYKPDEVVKHAELARRLKDITRRYTQKEKR